jgi:hypothetical protein
MRRAARSAASLVSMLALSCGAGTGSGPSPTPTASPAPTASPTPLSVCARLGTGTGTGATCRRTHPTFWDAVQDAVNQTRLANVDAYPWTSGGYRVTTAQLDGFFQEVLDRLNARGDVCAIRDGLELAVKNTNDSSEQYRFWVSPGHLRVNDQTYRSTCTPAWF